MTTNTAVLTRYTTDNVLENLAARGLGGKARNLIELLEADVNVPPSFTVDSRAYFEILELLVDRFEAMLQGIDVTNNDALEPVAEAMREAFVAEPLIPGLYDAIEDALARNFPGGPLRLATRSSAGAEDGEKDSFAGQQATYTNRYGTEDVVRHVIKCFASWFNKESIMYRHQRGYPVLGGEMAVVVQRMIQSDVSGVTMSIDPVTFKRTIFTITAVRGLGEGIVSGRSTPASWDIDTETGQIVKYVPAEQTEKLVMRDGPVVAGEEADEYVLLTQEELDTPPLTDAQVLEIYATTQRISAHYGKPMDIEWAVENGVLWTLQARPVTVVKDFMAETPLPTVLQLPIFTSGRCASPGVAVGPVRVIPTHAEIGRMQEGDILVAPWTEPTYLPGFALSVAVATDSGGPTSHAAIVAREAGLPAIVGAGKGIATGLPDGEVITLVSSSQGVAVYRGEVPELVEWWAAEQVRRAELEAATADLVTKTKIYGIVGAEETGVVAGVDGVGLLRMELLLTKVLGEHPLSYLDSGRREVFISTLAETLIAVCRAYGNRKVVVRTSDLKTNEYYNLRNGHLYEDNTEQNPMMGVRGGRRYILQPEAFRMEVEALRRVYAAGCTNMVVMLPFIRSVKELADVVALMAEFGLPRSPDWDLWMMFELPKNGMSAPAFFDLGVLTGGSIGSNDLLQLTFGLDRDGGDQLAGVDATERDEAMLEFYRRCIDAAHAARYVNAAGEEVPCTMGFCGNGVTTDPQLAADLVEMEIDSVSVMPDVIGLVRKLVHDAELIAA